MDHFYRKVYAPDGTMFEVNPEKAAQLVLNKGWFNTPPKKEKPAQKRGKKAVAPEESVAEDAADNSVEVETEGAHAFSVSDE